MNRLSGKNVFITGATKGIGKSTAIKFAEMGANVILVGRTKSLLEELKKEIEDKYKVEAYILELDVTKGKDVEEKIDSLPKDIKNNIDILVNNAG